MPAEFSVQKEPNFFPLEDLVCTYHKISFVRQMCRKGRQILMVMEQDFAHCLETIVLEKFEILESLVPS